MRDALSIVIGFIGTGLIGWGIGHAHGWTQGRLAGRAEILHERTLR